MELILQHASSRCVVVEINDGGKYYTKEPYGIFVNGLFYKETQKVITTVYGLLPNTDYEISVRNLRDETLSATSVKTNREFVTLNVKDFGAKGDGISDDTKFIQAAILACPKDSRILIPKGKYLITSLFLKSDINIELSKDCELIADTDRNHYPKFPALIEIYDEKDEYLLGTWEGNPLPMFTAIIMGINVQNVLIYGEGCINGNASRDNWWDRPKEMRGAFRPRLFHINNCENVTVLGVTFKNSPSWTIHPFFSSKLRFIDLFVNNPADSPNTDGLDPESCKDIDILGVHFSLGDDCIAVKSGKIYLGKKHKRPSENIIIRQCLMENGHGAVTIGSEMAGGVKNLTVDSCLFNNTDRGLRIKTRRGRGKDAIIDNIEFKNIQMDHVMTPFVVNAFYFCDPDGKTEYVQSREVYPVDDRTPKLKHFRFENIQATNCHVAAVYMEGLPEEKIEEIIMRNISVSYAENPKCDVPAMSSGVEACSKKGIVVKNVKYLLLENVKVNGQEGDPVQATNVSDFINK